MFQHLHNQGSFFQVCIILVLEVFSRRKHLNPSPNLEDPNTLLYSRHLGLDHKACFKHVLTLPSGLRSSLGIWLWFTLALFSLKSEGSGCSHYSAAMKSKF